jgi:hypothetical protein
VVRPRTPIRQRAGRTRIESTRGRVGAMSRGREDGGRAVQGSDDGLQERRWGRGDSAGREKGGEPRRRWVRTGVRERG